MNSYIKTEAQNPQQKDLLPKITVLPQDQDFIIASLTELTGHYWLANTKGSILTPTRPAGEETI